MSMHLKPHCGQPLPSFPESEKMMPRALHWTAGWGYNEITIPVLEQPSLTGNANM